MKPSRFAESNVTLLDNGYRSDAVASIAKLPSWTDGEMCVSCWRMSWRERLSALFFGKAWVSVLSGSTQPPMYVVVAKTYFVRTEANVTA